MRVPRAAVSLRDDLRESAVADVKSLTVELGAFETRHAWRFPKCAQPLDMHAVLSVILAGASALLTPPAVSPTTERLALKKELLDLLVCSGPSNLPLGWISTCHFISDRPLLHRVSPPAMEQPAGPPCRLAGRTAEIVEALELLEAVPATSEFLSLGVSGSWELRGVKDSSELSEADASRSTLPPAVELLEVQQELDVAAETARGLVKFRVVADDMLGSLDLSAIAAHNAEHADTLNFVTSARQLHLPRAPSCAVPDLMHALHAGLSHDFLGEEGVRLSLQTTYVDESLRITRCTTRALAGACAVHVRC